MEPEKSNRPPSDPFRQQKLASWQPVMTPLKVIIIFLAIGVAFIPTGTTLLAASNDIYEDSIKYDGSGYNVDCKITEENQNRQCELTFSFDEDVDGPIYVYYELENFYQNHRKYVNSRDPYQLQGQQLSESELKLTCQTEYKNDSLIINPCGLIANSLFTDIIEINSESTSADPDGVVMDEDSISWPSDKDKFLQVDGFKSFKWGEGVAAVSCEAAGMPSDCQTYSDKDGQSYSFYYPNEDEYQYLYESYPNQISPIKGVTDEHFMVWMRTAALPNFRKLYGKINQDFRKGDELKFDISANFEVNSFDGSKAITIGQVGEFGGKNAYLGIAYIVVGAISLMFALLFVTKQTFAPRQVADPTLLNWQ